MTNVLNLVVLICSAATAVFTLISLIFAVTGKVFNVKTHTQVALENHESRIEAVETYCEANRRDHAMLFKCQLALIDGIKRGNINGDIDDIREEMTQTIFEHLGKSSH